MRCFYYFKHWDAYWRTVLSDNPVSPQVSFTERRSFSFSSRPPLLFNITVLLSKLCSVVYCYEKKMEKQFEFRREIYKSYNACCTAYNLAQEYVAIKAKREKITRQEAMEKLLAQRESEKTI